MKNKFWNWLKNDAGERTLFLDGPIAEHTWFGDEEKEPRWGSSKLFKEELLSGTGDITVYINSPGGDVFAAAQIYNALMEYNGHVLVKIDGIAASAASVIAMAGSEVCMSPVSCMMIHNPATIAIGDAAEMEKAKAMLDEVKESIVNAYELKTSQSRLKIARWMDAETWMNAHKAVELGFADKILFSDENQPADDTVTGMMFSRAAVTNSLLQKLPKEKPAPPAPQGTSIDSLYKRLSVISH